MGEMVESLNKQKIPNTLKILIDTYSTSDIITLQEVSASLIDHVKNGELGKKFWIVSPFDMDAFRNQNSVIMLNRTTFPSGPNEELTKIVKDSFPSGVKIPVSGGGINVITANDAIIKTIKDHPSLTNHRLIFGLDANTYEYAT